MKHILSLLACTCVVLLSCDKSEKTEVSVPQDYDDVQFFQNRFAPLDNEGNVILTSIGVSLDSLDRSVVSAQCAGLEPARELMLPFFQFPERFSKKKDGTYVYEFRQKDGHLEGKAVLQAGNGDNMSALMKFEPEGLVSNVSRIEFLSVWPDNGSSPYRKYYRRIRDSLEYICVREASPGNEGLFISEPFVNKASVMVQVVMELGKKRFADYYLSEYFNSNGIHQFQTAEYFRNAIVQSIDTLSTVYSPYNAASSIPCYDDLEGNLLAINIGSGQVDTLYNANTASANVSKYDISLVSFKFTTFIDGVVHGTGVNSTGDGFPGYGGTTYDNDIVEADAPMRTLYNTQE